ncbi:Scr1 family TA system antitoxin-like transcriptional regulator [Amycolatopsis sp. NPDC059021]|uniref:Scr1 family TA system antitoxin-like transcriptional regulator n=1 Tax=Amycolatopsis sp. NPDC059021 TaxID=3346704 RepID=UPI00366FA2E5
MRGLAAAMGVQPATVSLAELATRRPKVERVVPGEGEWHPSLISPFTVYEFKKRRPLVTLDHHYVGAYVTGQDAVARYQQSMNQLAAKRAWGEATSRAVIAKAAVSLESG